MQSVGNYTTAFFLPFLSLVSRVVTLVAAQLTNMGKSEHKAERKGSTRTGEGQKPAKPNLP